MLDQMTNTRHINDMGTNIKDCTMEALLSVLSPCWYCFLLSLICSTSGTKLIFTSLLCRGCVGRQLSWSWTILPSSSVPSTSLRNSASWNKMTCTWAHGFICILQNTFKVHVQAIMAQIFSGEFPMFSDDCDVKRQVITSDDYCITHHLLIEWTTFFF